MDEAIGGRASVTPVNLFVSGGPAGPSTISVCEGTEKQAGCDMPAVAISQSIAGDTQSSAAGTHSREAQPRPSGIQKKSKKTESPRKRKETC